MIDIIGLFEIDPIKGDSPETLGFRSCDLCGGSCPDDGFGHWRTFYHDPREGLDVCEHCVTVYLSEKPS